MEDELCRYCDGIILIECEVQEHWERRLKNCNLPSSGGVDSPYAAQVTVGGVTRQRLVPMTGKYSIENFAS